MSIYAIGDLHLAFNENKPMSIFGENWENHEYKIQQNWLKKIEKDDVVLLPGDFSWSMYLEDTYKDFEYLNNLPGRKILLKGNHDYWWTTVTKMNNYLKENNYNNIDFLYNNSYKCEDYIIAGTRGWSFGEDPEDKKILKREALRLELSLKDAISKYGNNSPIIVIMHYPPITKAHLTLQNKPELIQIMKKYNVSKCIYGHLHGNSIKDAVEGIIDGIEFKLVSADSLNFEPIKI
jgi:predicted phosphohydrolase